MHPQFSTLIRSMYRSARHDRRKIPHVLRVLAGFAQNYLWLQSRRLGPNRRPILAIALIEHMGDIVAAEPVSRFARAQHPQARIVWITRKPYKEIAGNYPSVDRILEVHCLTQWLLLWSLDLFDTVWDLHISGRICYGCNVTLLKSGPAGKLTFDTFYNFGNLLALNCVNAGIPPITDGPVLHPDPTAEAKVNSFSLPQNFITIHARSSETRRDWQVEKWQALVSWLTDDLGIDVVEVGSQPYIITATEGRKRSLCGALSILETAEVLRRASLFIGVDSGPAHLANAVGTQGVILLGHLGPFQRYVPYSGSYANGVGADLIHWNDVPASIPLETVMSLVARRLEPRSTAAEGTPSVDSMFATPRISP
jgi:heptosyltransferase-3